MRNVISAEKPCPNCGNIYCDLCIWEIMYGFPFESTNNEKYEITDPILIAEIEKERKEIEDRIREERMSYHRRFMERVEEIRRMNEKNRNNKT
jgi:hypothetical protein